MWNLYDDLISGINTDARAHMIIQGATWTVVKAGKYCGSAATVNEQNLSLIDGRNYEGRMLKELAELSKSWNLQEAGIGVAAINAWYNHPDNLPCGSFLTTNTFDDYEDRTSGAKVAFIGHFGHLERFLTKAASITVLERCPGEGDLPDSACEYILPYQDFVFITGSALVNKTLPRLLQLSANAHTVVLGPSTPMAECLFKYSVNVLSGLSISNKGSYIDRSFPDYCKAIFEYGDRLSFEHL